MHRIDGPGATVDNKFTEGNPATAVPATDVTGDWLNDVQEELLSVLVAAGIAPVKGTQNQILLALRAAGVFTTPPQFDNTTRAATTAFMQRALGSYRGYQVVLGATTLTAANVGNIIQCNNTGYNITLPVASTVPSGGAIHFRGYTAGTVSIIRAGADGISYGVSSGFTSIPLSIGGSLTLVSNGTDTWQAVDGSDTLPYNTGLFGSLLAGSGWQRLPSGTILQWCETTQEMAVANTNYTWTATLPMSFPTACRQAFGVFGNNNPAAGFLNITTEALGLSSIQGVCSASSASTRTIRVYAIGN